MIQWAREQGRSHPKIRGVFWVGASFIFMGMPNMMTATLVPEMNMDVATCIVMPVIILMMFTLQKDNAGKPTFRSVLLMILAGASAAAIFSFFMDGVKIKGNPEELSWFHYVAAFASAAILIPIYEEKLCRGLQLEGLQAIAGNVAAILATSILFSLAHKGNEIATFIHAIILASLAVYCRMGTIARAAAHGAYNFTLYLYALFYIMSP